MKSAELFKKTIRLILGLLISLSLVIVLIEISLQIISLVSPDSGTYTQGLNPSSKFMGYDTALLWKIRPNVDIDFRLLDGDIFSVKTIDLGLDAIGFRDDGINGSVYAVVLGDSFTFGAVNQDDTWVEKLEVKSGKDFINMGVPAYSTLQSEKTLEIYSDELMPKLIMIQFYHNDIEGNQLLTSKTRGIRNWLLWNTKTYGGIRYLLYQLSGSATSTSVDYINEKFNFTFQTSQFPYKENTESKTTQEGVSLTRESLLRIKNISDSIGAKMVVVIMPSKEQIYGNLASDKIKSFDEMDYDYYTDAVDQICQEEKLTCLNLVQTFKEASKNAQLFYAVDSHFNLQGNELAAEEINRFLQSEDLLGLDN